MSPAPARARAAVRAPAQLTPAPGVRPPPARSRPPLRLVDDRRWQLALRRRRARRLVAAAVVLVIASLLALAGAHAVLVSNQVHVDQLEQRVAEAQTRHQALRLEVARLEAPDRIVSAATERLGMVPPESVTYLRAPEVPALAEAEPEDPDSSAEPAPASWGLVKPYLGSRP